MKPIKHSTLSVGFAALIALAGSACATSQPPSELLMARNAYQSAQNGPAWDYDPAGLHDAELALRRAEASFEDDGASEGTRDAATVALRRAQQAEYKAEQASLRAAEQTVAEELATQQQDEQSAAVRQGSSDIGLEARTTDVEPQGIAVRVIPDGSLFDSGTSSIREDARPELEEVANVLRMQGDESSIVIEGHADAQGSASDNLELSQARAETVASFLVSRGVPRENVDTVARGERAPIASDATPSGRALNRRIEMKVRPLGDAT